MNSCEDGYVQHPKIQNNKLVLRRPGARFPQNVRVSQGGAYLNLVMGDIEMQTSVQNVVRANMFTADSGSRSPQHASRAVRIAAKITRRSGIPRNFTTGPRRRSANLSLSMRFRSTSLVQ